MQTTEQFAKEYVHFDEERYQIHQRQEQTTKVTQQFQLQTTQVAAQTFQTRQVQQRILQTQEQWTTAKSQWVTTTTQYVMQSDQYRYGVQQVFMHRYQTIAYTDADETGIPLPGDGVPSSDIKHQTREPFAPSLVDPGTYDRSGPPSGRGRAT
jgi:hypothetical protein